MRISAGFAKGMELKVPKSLSTRPTSEKARAAILNSLQFELAGARILELYAGTGALGLEAVSRGAKSCLFVEKAKEALACLKENLNELCRRANMQSIDVQKPEVVAGDVRPFLNTTPKVSFDIIFADPPYQEFGDLCDFFLERLGSFLSTEGVLVLESDSTGEKVLEASIAKFPKWQMQRYKNYGGTKVFTLCYNRA